MVNIRIGAMAGNSLDFGLHSQARMMQNLEYDWTFQRPLNEDQKITISLSIIYMFVIILLWHTKLMYMFKLVTVLLHESGHAGAALL